VKEPNVVQGLLQAAFTAVDEGRERGGARQSRALMVGSTVNTRRRQQNIIATVMNIVSRGPRRTVDEDGRQVILVARQLVRVRHCVCRCAASVYSEVLRCKNTEYIQ
jgi:hypothetical protein